MDMIHTLDTYMEMYGTFCGVTFHSLLLMGDKLQCSVLTDLIGTVKVMIGMGTQGAVNHDCD